MAGVVVSGGVEEVESPPLLPFPPSVVVGTGGSEGVASSLFPLPLFPPVPVGTVGDTAGEVIVESGRLAGGSFESFPSFPSPPSEGKVEETGGDETVELGVSEETAEGRTVEDVGSAAGIEEDETELSLLWPPSVTVI